MIDLYDEQGRIVGGDHDTMLDAAYHAWQNDMAAGRSSILIAETSDTVVALNQRARADRILAEQVAVEGVALHDGTVAGRGDTIVTRENDRRLITGRSWVKNGDTWTVVDAHTDGSLTVQRPGARGRRGRVDQAVQERQPWVRRLGTPPPDPARRAAWVQQVRCVAAYRDRYGITSSDPLGQAPNGQGQRLDYQHADAAARRAQATAKEQAQRRHGHEKQIDSGLDLSR